MHALAGNNNDQQQQVATCRSVQMKHITALMHTHTSTTIMDREAGRMHNRQQHNTLMQTNVFIRVGECIIGGWRLHNDAKAHRIPNGGIGGHTGLATSCKKAARMLQESCKKIERKL
jgi:hypothetical protein